MVQQLDRKAKAFGTVAVLVLGCATLLLTLDARADFYNCFEGCAGAALAVATNCSSGADYEVTITDTNRSVVVLSFHGGRIELNTTTISAELARRFQWDRYDFSGHGTAACLAGMSNFQKLHITAANFNDNRAVSLLRSHRKAVSIHGYGTSHGYARGLICVGGLDQAAREAFIASVGRNSPKWTAYPLMPVDATTSKTMCEDMRGVDPANLVNRTATGRGLQLELHPDIRADLSNASPNYDALRNVVYEAIREAMMEP